MEQYRVNPTPEGAIGVHQQLFKFHQAEQAAEFQKTMSEKYADNAKVQSYLGAALEHVGKTDEAATYFQRALALRPDLPEARIGAARGYVRAGRLDEARKLLDFLEKPGAAQLYSLHPLETLALAYQKAGSHQEALDLFAKLQAELPKITEVKGFRDMVKKSEKALDRKDSMLPKQKFSWRRFFTLPSGAAGRAGADNPRNHFGAGGAGVCHRQRIQPAPSHHLHPQHLVPTRYRQTQRRRGSTQRPPHARTPSSGGPVSRHHHRRGAAGIGFRGAQQLFQPLDR
jgi:tetratricopeptide (TPR) repeat protein